MTCGRRKSRAGFDAATFIITFKADLGLRFSCPIHSIDAVPIISFTMAAEFTCRKCVQTLGMRLRSQVRSSHSAYTARRFNSSNHSLRNPVTTAPHSTAAAASKANFSSSSTAAVGATQTQIPINEPGPVPTPPGLSSTPIPQTRGRAILRPDNLFHSFTNSPIPSMRQRAAAIRKEAYCPHPDHQRTRVPQSPSDPENRKDASNAKLPPAHVDFECPDCGIPVYCSEEHWADDYESHTEIVDTLRQINEDDHDLRSGRFFPEFEYPGPQIEELLVNMTNWDTYLYTREFRALNEDRAMRHATRMLTYPVTIASVLHELSPYDIRSGGRLTVEGLKSLSGRLMRSQVI